MQHPDLVPDTATLIAQQRAFLEYCLGPVADARDALEALAVKVAPLLIAPGHDTPEMVTLRASAVDMLLAVYAVAVAVLVEYTAGYEQRQRATLGIEAIAPTVPAAPLYEQ